MANRTFQHQQDEDEAGLVRLHATVAFNSTSAPSLLVCNLGTGNYTVAPTAGTFSFKTFTRTGAGIYLLTLKDPFIRLRAASLTLISSADPVAPIWSIRVASDPTNAQAFGTSIGCGAVRGTTSTVGVRLYSSQGTAADPAATEMALIELVVQNSTANSGMS